MRGRAAANRPDHMDRTILSAIFYFYFTNIVNLNSDRDSNGQFTIISFKDGKVG